MAQYGKNIYGTSYFGVTSAYSGQYITNIFNTGNVLNGSVNIVLNTILPTATYLYNSSNIIYSDNWVGGSTSVLNAKATLSVAARNIILNYNTASGTAQVTVKKLVNGSVVNTDVVTVPMTTGASYDLSSYTSSYAQYEVEITNTDTNSINISNFVCVVTDISVETSAAYDDESTLYIDESVWSNWELCTPVYTHVTGNQWTVSATSSSYSSKNRIKAKIHLASSDNLLTPEVSRFELNSGNVANHTNTGKYFATFRFGPSFKEYTDIIYTTTTPSSTRIYVQTQSSNNGSVWTILSAPYTQDDTNQIRLKEGSSYGEVVSNAITPENLTVWEKYRTIDWSGTVNNDIHGNITENMKVRYQILASIDGQWVDYYSGLPYQGASNWADITQMASNPITVPIKIKAILSRSSSSYPTPYVSEFELRCKSTYEENVIIPGDTSSVDSNNTGDKELVNLVDILVLASSDNQPHHDGKLTIPQGLEQECVAGRSLYPAYTHINRTGLPYVTLYWNSKGYGSGESTTLSQTDSLRIYCSETSNSQNKRFYQYGAASVVYPLTSEIPMYTYFICPGNSNVIMNGNKLYKYFLEMGWDSPGYPIEGNVNEDDRVIDIFWNSLSTDTPSGNPSTWNMVSSLEGDNICAKIYAPTAAAPTPWVSESKIIQGAFVNANSIKNNYVLNGIILPELDPEAILSNQPYVLEIVEGSVRCNNFTISDDIVNGDSPRLPHTLTIVKFDNTLEIMHLMTRGSGDTDVLPNNFITSIDGVYDSPYVSDPLFVDYIKDIDYTQNGNYIDWSLNERKPAAEAKYYISYKYTDYRYANVVFSCDYTEPIIQNDIWVSNVVTCSGKKVSSGNDMIEAIPDIEIPDNINTDTLVYIVDSNNIWVKTYIKDGNVVGTLNNLNPKDNWLPQVHNGFYYINKQRYFMYAEPEIIIIGDEHMPLSSDISYVDGRYEKGANTDHENAIITYPMHYNYSNPGGISLWFKSNTTMDGAMTSSPVFFEVWEDASNYIVLKYENGSIKFVSMNDSLLQDISYTFSDSLSAWNHLAVTWNNLTGNVNMYVNDIHSSSPMSISLFDGRNSDGTHKTKSLCIGNSRNSLGDNCNCILDDLVMFKYAPSTETISSIYTSTTLDFDSNLMTMKCGFEGNINETFDGSFVAINPAPQQRAPLVIQKQDGTPLRKVSFSDETTGEYTTYNTEEFISDGTNKINLTFSDLEVDKFRTVVYNDKNSIIGDPLSINGSEVTMTLTSDEAEALKGKRLKVIYQLRDCYIWDSNGKYGAAYIRLGQNTGEPLTITYEKNSLNYSLANTAELNPLYNPNHNGFMYITNDLSELSHFRVNLSPSNLLCNGVDMSTIIIETVDKHGNPTNNVDLELSMNKIALVSGNRITGGLIKYIVGDTVELKNTGSSYSTNSVAGRHIYMYTAPKISHEELPDATYNKITIYDSISGLGTEIKIRLMTINEYGM